MPCRPCRLLPPLPPTSPYTRTLPPPPPPRTRPAPPPFRPCTSSAGTVPSAPRPARAAGRRKTTRRRPRSPRSSPPPRSAAGSPHTPIAIRCRSRSRAPRTTAQTVHGPGLPAERLHRRGDILLHHYAEEHKVHDVQHCPRQEPAHHHPTPVDLAHSAPRERDAPTLRHDEHRHHPTQSVGHRRHAVGDHPIRPVHKQVEVIDAAPQAEPALPHVVA